jgi:hypothetical protein
VSPVNCRPELTVAAIAGFIEKNFDRGQCKRIRLLGSEPTLYSRITGKTVPAPSDHRHKGIRRVP